MGELRPPAGTPAGTAFTLERDGELVVCVWHPRGSLSQAQRQARQHDLWTTAEIADEGYRFHESEDAP